MDHASRHGRGHRQRCTKSLGHAPTPGVTLNYPLVGFARNSHLAIGSSLLTTYGIAEQTAKHLSQKFGTNATKVLQLANETRSRAANRVRPRSAGVRKIAYCVRNEMAVTIEGRLDAPVQDCSLFSWRARPLVPQFLRPTSWLAELGMVKQNLARNSAEEYVSRINRWIAAGRSAPNQRTMPAVAPRP